MSKLVDEIKSYIGSSKLNDEEFLEHYGMPRRSGRYPWGSGKDDYQHSVDFLGRIETLRKKGWRETPENIEKDFGLSVKDYRMEKTLCNNERRLYQVQRVKSLKDDGLNNNQIAKKLNMAESSVRSLLNEDSEKKMMLARETANFLKDRVSKDKMIDVGVNAEHDLNISREKLDTALYMLESQGYGVYSNRVPQPTNKNQMTTLKVLCDKDIKPKEGNKTPSEIYDYGKIKPLNEYITRDGGETYEKKFHYPKSIDGKRVKIVLKNEIGPDGLPGVDQDGLIQLRRGVPDLSLGNSRYAQVRILVDGTKYLKGMAVYSDNIPDGYDVVFNSNKKTREDAFKKIKNDPENPFGSAIKDVEQGGQYWYDDKTGKVWDPKNHVGNKKLGAINKRADEGDWTEWDNNLPSQFLSKQTIQMAKKQLDLSRAYKLDEFDEIKSLSNPTIKKYYLKKFADGCDSAAVDLKAASLPGQKYHVIIPINSLSDNEVYAPNYKPGTKLALIRYPHGGTFEIPILTVTDKNKSAERVIGKTSIDAVGINAKVASQLSGADFDGDTVMCIPTHDRKGKVKVSSQKPFDELKNFDTKIYQYDEITTDKNGKEHYFKNGREFKVMGEHTKQKEMGVVSNLITDMTLQAAPPEDLIRAVRHSMVVIDAEKHKLDYKKSEIDNNIVALKKNYQGKYDEDGNLIGYGGATTIISKSKGQLQVLKRKGQPRINQKGKPWYDPNKPEGSLLYTTAPDKELYYANKKVDKKTGDVVITTAKGDKIKYNNSSKEDREKYNPVMKVNPKTGEVRFTNKDGTIEYEKLARTTDTTKMAEANNAYDLVSPYRHKMEIVYADYANDMKRLANEARKELVYTPSLESNTNAKKIYAKEVSELNARLNEALKNSPKERYVSRLSTVAIKDMMNKNPDMSKDDIQKYSDRMVAKYRKELNTIPRKNRALTISDKEWEAIQAGAISENKLKTILNYTDPNSLRERAMPKNRNKLSAAQINRIKRMADSNFTIADIADKMNISTSQVSKYLKGEI